VVSPIISLLADVKMKYFVEVSKKINDQNKPIWRYADDIFFAHGDMNVTAHSNLCPRRPALVNGFKLCSYGD